SSGEAASDDLIDGVSALLDREQNGESPEAERTRCLDEMKGQWDRIVSLETELAETGGKLARLLELDDARCRQIESLELARSAQMSRLADLRTDLASHGIETDGSMTGGIANVVDLGARRPS
ncbi:MAG: hypothetical protein OEQ74_04895, partial [Gammaproteobacteria bacterium]|nr:hypothetical protein [Gammaproteobacteria bacterium]